MKHLVTFSPLLLLLGQLNLAQEPKAPNIADLTAHLRSRREATDFRVSGKLVRLGASGERRPYPYSMTASSIDGAIKIFLDVSAPPPSGFRLLLESAADGGVSARMGHSGDAAPRTLSFQEWGQPILESDFNYEDLLETQFLWKRQMLVREERCGARQCYVVISEPGAEDKSHYSSVTSWLDRETYYPVKVEKVVRVSGISKTFTAFGLRESKGLWSASQIEARTSGRTGSTLLIISRGTGKAHVAASEFDPRLLTKADRTRR